MNQVSSSHHRLFKQPKFRALLTALLFVSLSLGLIIVPVERQVGRIDSYFDGIWWAVGTMTTVGYGDYVPVTNLGRVIGIVLQIIGAMMFGMTVAMIGNYMSRVQDEFYWRRLFERTDRLERMMTDLIKRTDFLVKDGQHDHDQPA